MSIDYYKHGANKKLKTIIDPCYANGILCYKVIIIISFLVIHVVIKILIIFICLNSEIIIYHRIQNYNIF